MPDTPNTPETPDQPSEPVMPANFNLTTIIDWATKASLGTLLLAILLLGQMGVWVWGSQYNAMLAERNEWRDIALKAAHIAEESNFRVIGEPSPLHEVHSKIRELEAAANAAAE